MNVKKSQKTYKGRYSVIPLFLSLANLVTVCKTPETSTFPYESTQRHLHVAS